MDAVVEQHGDFRFFYLLPFSETELLIEDTYYSDQDALPVEEIVQRVHAYARGKGWEIRKIDREEKGVLPIVLAGAVSPFLARPGEAARSGVRAGLFHPLTGYSLADAVRLAERIVALGDVTTTSVRAACNDLSSELWAARSYYRLLNRLLFAGAEGDERRAVMARFYTLSQGIVERLYAGRTTTFDKLRILSGRPPIPISRALPVLPPSAGWMHAAGGKAAREGEA
jgi:lycopene beta-cyclase